MVFYTINQPGVNKSPFNAATGSLRLFFKHFMFSVRPPQGLATAALRTVPFTETGQEPSISNPSQQGSEKTRQVLMEPAPPAR